MASRRKLKILLFNTAHRWIGEAATTHLIATELTRLGQEVHCLIPEENDFGNNLDHAKYKLIPIPWRNPGTKGLMPILRQYQSVHSEIKKFKPDIIHVGRGKEHWCIAILRGLFFRYAPIVRTRHVVLPQKQHGWNKALFLYSTDAITAISEIALDGLGDLGKHLPDDRRKVIYGAINEDKFGPEKRSEEFRVSLGVKPDQFLVGCIGRWQTIKGQDTFMEAMKIVHEKNPNIVPLMSGRKVTLRRPITKKLHEKLGLEGIMNYLDHVDKPEELIASLDLGVIASRGSEGFSRIAAEYMASIVPILTTNVGALPEMIQHEHNGIMIEPGDPEKMAEEILKLEQNPELRKKLTENGRKVFEEKFSRKHLKEILDLYNNLLN